jgi:Ca2+-binding RTX toxin-like protein
MRHPPVEPLELRRLLAADLIAVIDVPPTLLTQVSTLQPAVTVFNAGDERVAAIWTMRFVLSPDPILGNGNDLTIGTDTRTAVPAGGSIEVRPAMILPFLPARGSYHVGIVLDTGSNVAESDESNNVAFTPLPVVTVFNGTGMLPIAGTDGDDHIRVTQRGLLIDVEINDLPPQTIVATNATGLSINSAGGNDVIEVVAQLDATIDAGEGNDTVVSGAGDDVISGGGGRDRLFGADGDDHVIGGPGADRLFGDDGNDTVSGNGGHDHLRGGNGADWLIGGTGNDYLFAADGLPDTAIGSAGDDLAEVDTFDLLVNALAVQ